MRRQLGKFYLPCEYIQTEAREAMEIFKHCAIVRAEKLYERDMYEYLALSHQFDVLPQGYSAPEYKWEHRKGDFWATRVTV